MNIVSKNTTCCNSILLFGACLLYVYAHSCLFVVLPRGGMLTGLVNLLNKYFSAAITSSQAKLTSYEPRGKDGGPLALSKTLGPPVIYFSTSYGIHHVSHPQQKNISSSNPHPPNTLDPPPFFHSVLLKCKKELIKCHQYVMQQTSHRNGLHI